MGTFFLIAVGRAARGEIRRLNINARQIESLFHWLYDLTKSASYDVTPREGYHYRRVLLQRKAEDLGIPVEELLSEVKQKPLTPSEFKFICGGSRARAYALTGDPMGSDPYCVYQPAAWKTRRSVMDRQAEGDDRRVFM